MAAFLVLADGKRITVEDGLILGRDPRAGLVLTDKKASRRHARLISQGGVVEIEDLDSSNGTRLNGNPVARRMLRDGDVVTIGTTDIEFREEVEAKAPDVAFAPGEDLFGDEPEEASSGTEGGVETIELVRHGPQHESKPAAPPPSPATPPPPSRAAEPKAAASFEPVVEVRTSKTEAPSAQEEVLEFADDDVVVVKRALPTKKPAKAQPATRDGGVLQFQKVEDRDGFVVQDLNQMSFPVRMLLTLVALVAAAGLFYLAMRLAG